MADDHAIFVGGKPFMNYVTAVVMQFTTKGADTVVIRSRGKFISRAVDVAEVVKSRFLREQIEVGDISIDSEEFKNKEGRTVRVSTLDICLDRRATKAPPAAPVKAPEKPAEAVPEVAPKPAPVVLKPAEESEPIEDIGEEAVEEEPAEE